ncbi:hypothetical protein ARALYDRAFT_901872 [Arabidopsis lyrata subsp. lyrata]|uniref:Uncharacterized protein n=1 Tax=Arabidopsis lyrata subsp. lyrata TaxID=81972 RepID=D7LKM9_ARALL|nr:hypothetical protein ARALYDRAFT_901872 [Arabidopsis lyrata subsp. lyrata]
MRLFSHQINGHGSTLAVPQLLKSSACGFILYMSWTKSFKTNCCLTNLDTRPLGGSEDGLVFFL